MADRNRELVPDDRLRGLLRRLWSEVTAVLYSNLVALLPGQQ